MYKNRVYMCTYVYILYVHIHLFMYTPNLLMAMASSVCETIMVRHHKPCKQILYVYKDLCMYIHTFLYIYMHTNKVPDDHGE